MPDQSAVQALAAELPELDPPLAIEPPLAIDPPLAIETDEQPPLWRHRRTKRLEHYLQADFLHWWAGESTLPRLLASDPAGTPLANVGVGPATRTAYGDQTVGDFGHPGIRLRFGRFVPRSRVSRLEMDLWYLFERSDDFSSTSLDSSLLLSRPFFNAQTGANDSQIIRFPGVADGEFSSQYTRQLAGFDPSVSFCLGSDACSWWECSTGYRFLWLQDELELNERVFLPAGGLIAPGTGFDVRDRFTANNYFHLWRFGLSHVQNRGRWLVSLRGNIGFGLVHHVVRIRGQTDSLINNTVVGTDDAGFLALQTNRGKHERAEFGWVPDVELGLKRRLTDNLTAHAGYTLLWLPNVVKAADHVPTTIDPRNLPIEQPGAGPEPTFAYHTDDILVHGLNFGVRYDW